MRTKRKMEIEVPKAPLEKERIIRILDHQLVNESECMYLCEWNNKEKTWEPDSIKEKYKTLIAAYFRNTDHVFKDDKKKKKPDYINQAFEQNKGATGKNLHVQEPMTIEKKEQIKNIQAGICRFEGKDLDKFKDLIRDLDDTIANTPAIYRKDYQIEYVEGVFKNRLGKVSFVVKTVTNKSFVVTMKNMKKHFPRSLRNYFMSLIGLHTIEYTSQVQVQRENQDHMFYYESQVEDESGPSIDISENESNNDL